MSVIINADDFGMSREINEGIVKAFKEKVIDSVSIIDGPEKKEAIKLAKKHKMPCGIHLYKKGPVYFTFLNAIFSRNFQKQLEQDFEKQILDLKKELKPLHMDSHQHIHMFPPIFNIAARLAKKYNLRIRLSKAIDISLFNKLGLALFYPKNKKKALKSNIGVIDSYGTNYRKLKKLTCNIKEGEIIVHPGIMDEKKVKRRRELDILLNIQK